MRGRWLIDAEDACAGRFSISEVVIHEQRSRRPGKVVAILATSNRPASMLVWFVFVSVFEGCVSL